MRILFLLLLSVSVKAQTRVLGLYTAKHDLAHISYVHEANKWFYEQCKRNGLRYDSSNDWSRLNVDTLKPYALVLFLDTRPEDPAQRSAFEQYMKNGGAWMGFHFAAFAMNGSTYPQNWDWYHNEFLGSGEFVSNTWRPTPASLRDRNKIVFRSAPNEWYRWKNDLRKNPDIEIMLSIDSSSFPLGTGPKPHEIWHSGFYPVVWRNTKYKMVYFNMGHNDMDYGGTNGALSFTFANEAQSNYLLQAMLNLIRRSPSRR